MKLKAQSNDSLCPVCALGGVVSPLQMAVDSLAILCPNGHTFDTLALSALANLGEKVLDDNPE